jgi:hypothetical protein
LGQLTRLDPPLQHQEFGNMAGQHAQNVPDKTSMGVHVEVAGYVIDLSEQAWIHLKVTPCLLEVYRRFGLYHQDR